jgi:hydrogenase maturation protein HypF
LLRKAFDSGLNAPTTTSVGRLFDGAAALLGVCSRASYEGEAAMRLEALCQEVVSPLPLPLVQDLTGIWRSDWGPLVSAMLDANVAPDLRAALFHATLARALCEQALAVRNQTGVSRVGLSGGVFQNRVLTERTQALLSAEGFDVLLPERLPTNDAAISFGQLVEAAAVDARASTQ